MSWAPEAEHHRLHRREFALVWVASFSVAGISWVLVLKEEHGPLCFSWVLRLEQHPQTQPPCPTLFPDLKRSVALCLQGLREHPGPAVSMASLHDSALWVERRAEAGGV